MNKRISFKTFLLQSILQHKEKPRMKSSLVDSSYPLLIKWLFVTNIPTQISNQVAQRLHSVIFGGMKQIHPVDSSIMDQIVIYNLISFKSYT